MMTEFDPHDCVDALFDSNYLRWFHLEGQPALIKITKMKKDVELTLPGGIPAKKPVMHFEQVNGKIIDVKPLVLNKTNAHDMSKIHGNKPSGWPGKEIVLYPTTTRMYNKETKTMEDVGCIRVRAKKGK